MVQWPTDDCNLVTYQFMMFDLLDFSDLTRPHPKLNPLISGKLCLLKYYSLARSICLMMFGITPGPSEITLVGGSPSGRASFVCGYTASTGSTGMVGVWAERRVWGRLCEHVAIIEDRTRTLGSTNHLLFTIIWEVGALGELTWQCEFPILQSETHLHSGRGWRSSLDYLISRIGTSIK